MNTQNLQVIDGAVRCIRDMFSGRTYSIEYYQREYSWSRSNIEELIEDFYRSFMNDYEPKHAHQQVASYSPYFLGPVVTFNSGGIRFLVDGQQRMTSLSLLMIHLANLVSETDTHAESQLRTLVYQRTFGQSRFTIDVEDRQPVMVAIRDQSSIERISLDQSSRNIWDRYNDIKQVLPSELVGGPLTYFIDWLLNRVVMVEIGTTDKNMALEIFESMNDRGLRLSSMDMLKSYLLSHIHDSHHVAVANTSWRGVTQNLRDLDKNADSDFMKAFLRAKFAMSVRDTKKASAPRDFEEIASTFHKWVRDNATLLRLENEIDFGRFINDEIVYFARRYQTLIETSNKWNPQFSYVFYNAWNNFTLQNMVILAATRVSDNDEIFAAKANLIAKYLDLMITRRMCEYKNFGYSPMYRPMFQLAKDIRDLDLDEVRFVLKQKAAEQSESLDGLKRLRLTGTNRPDIYYILARLTVWLENESAPAQQPVYFERRLRDPFEVEHIWADKAEQHINEVQDQAKFNEIRNLLGDLILLPKSFNASFGSVAFQEKVNKYFGQNLLAQTLSKESYKHSPNFLRRMKKYSLPFKSYESFPVSAIEERQDLYFAMASIIWSPEILEEKPEDSISS